MTRNLLSPLLAALALVLMLPAAASAATAGESGGELSFQAAPGEANQTTVTIDPATKELFFFEGSVDITPGPGCASEPTGGHAKSIVRCQSTGVTRIRVDLGDGDDEVFINYDSGQPVTVSGGSGTDLAGYGLASVGAPVSLDGVANDGPSGRGDNIGADVENIDGTVGDDSLTGNAAPNRVTGGDGRDTISTGAGDDFIASDEHVDTSNEPAGGPSGEADTIDCGDGFDIVDGDVTDQIAADCEVVARNNLIFGTTGPDKITAFRAGLGISGSAGDDVLVGLSDNDLSGGSGSDTIRAGDGRNSLSGGSGNDTLTGGSGKDYVSGGYGNDKISTGAGNDRVDGANAGRDTISTGAGNDVIVAKERGDEPDTVKCGSGKDTVLAGKHDHVSRDCEKVTRR